MHLPNNFLWGSSTNAQQFEGAYNEAHKGISISDMRHIEGFSDFKVASDHYHHLEEDLDLFQEMGFSIYRFSIAWTRLFPTGEEDKPLQEGLDFYDKMVDGLIQRDIIPVCTLYAYDMPYHLLERYQGFLDRAVIDKYIHYVETVFTHFKGRIKYYTPFNEPNLFHRDSEYILGNKNLSDKQIWQIEHHLTLAYARCVNCCHEIDPEAKIGPNCACMMVYPDSCDPYINKKVRESMYLTNWAYLDVYTRGAYPQYFLNYLKKNGWMFEIEAGDLELIASVKPDLISTTYYSTSILGQTTKPIPEPVYFQEATAKYRTNKLNPYCDETHWGWTIDPEGFYYQLMELYHRYQLPILILENGMGDLEELDSEGKVHDDKRIDYLKKHIEKMKEAIEDGVEIIGYLTWSAIDLHSTREGFIKRYGFVYIDRDEYSLKTLKRYKKKSFYWYQKVIKTNGEDLINDIKY